LTGAAQALGIDQIGHIDLGIAVFSGVDIEHELDQRPLQPRQGAGEGDEARARHLGRAIEVHPAVARPEIDVIPRLEIELRRRPPTPFLAVIGGVAPLGDIGGRQIGQAQTDVGQLVLDCAQARLGGLEPLTQIGDLGQERREVLALGLGAPDRLGAGVARVLELLDLDLERLALGLQGLNPRGVEHQTAPGQLLGDLVESGAQQTWV
jgi:hypothetical protein